MQEGLLLLNFISLPKTPPQFPPEELHFINSFFEKAFIFSGLSPILIL